MSHTVLWCSRKNNNDVSWYWCRYLCPYQTAPVQHKPFKTGDHENWGRLPASKRAGYTQPKSLEFSKLAGLKARFYLSFLYRLPKGKQRYKAWFLFLTPNGRLHGQGWCFEVCHKVRSIKVLLAGPFDCTCVWNLCICHPWQLPPVQLYGFWDAKCPRNISKAHAEKNIQDCATVKLIWMTLWGLFRALGEPHR